MHTNNDTNNQDKDSRQDRIGFREPGGGRVGRESVSALVCLFVLVGVGVEDVPNLTVS